MSGYEEDYIELNSEDGDVDLFSRRLLHLSFLIRKGYFSGVLFNGWMLSLLLAVIVKLVRRRNLSGCMEGCGGCCCWFACIGCIGSSSNHALEFHGGWTKYKQSTFKALQIAVAVTIVPTVLFNNAVMETSYYNILSDMRVIDGVVEGNDTLTTDQDSSICVQIALGYKCYSLEGVDRGGNRTTTYVTCDTDLKITNVDSFVGNFSFYNLLKFSIDNRSDDDQDEGYLPEQLPATFEWTDDGKLQSQVTCDRYHDQSPIIWFDAVGIAAGVVGVFIFSFLQLDWLVSIGANESRSNGKWKRIVLTLILVLCLITSVSAIVVIIKDASSTDTSPVLDTVLGMFGILSWVYASVAYISKYDTGTDRLAILTALFEAYSTDNTVEGHWTPESTSKLAAHLKPTKATPDPKALLQLNGSELWHKMSRKPIDSGDVEESDMMNFGILTFVCAIKKVPVTVQTYSNPAFAAFLSFEEVWNATWDVMRTELDTRDTNCQYEWWNLDTEIKVAVDSVAVDISTQETVTNNAAF